MKYEVSLPGFENQSLFLEVRFPFRPGMIVNKKKVKGTGSWNEVSLRRDDGLNSIVTIRPGFPDPVPTLEMDGERYRVVPPFTWLQNFWATLPVLLGFLDPWGFLLGLAAAYLNFWILRFQIPRLEKNLMIFAVTAASMVLFFAIRFFMIQASLQG